MYMEVKVQGQEGGPERPGLEVVKHDLIGLGLTIADVRLGGGRLWGT